MKVKGNKKKKSNKKKKQKNNSEIYKNNLLKFVSQDKSKGNKTLSELVELKLAELKNEENLEKQNYYIILAFSLYFIKDNDFIQENEEFFNQIEDTIYDIFNKFLKNPTEEQHKEFLKSFENLNNGFDNIYLACKKLVGTNPVFRDIPVNYFFKIIIKAHFYELQSTFAIPITKDQNKIITNLIQYIKIKYNFNEVTKNDIFNLFTQETVNAKSDNGTILPNIIKEDDEKKEKPENFMNQTSEIIIKDNDSPKKDNIVIKNNNIMIGKYAQNKFLDYLEIMKDKYKNFKYEAPVLNYLAKNESKLKLNFFRYTKSKNNFIDHLYDYLTGLIFSMNSNQINYQEKKVGYICFHDKFKNEDFEGIYSNIDLKFLFEKVISDDNFPADDIYDTDDIIAKNAFKSRALSFEYYINSDIILNRLSSKERQRIIYLFRDIKDIETLDKNIEINNEKEDTTSSEHRLIEVDGVILEKENKECYLDKSFFMADPVYKFGFFVKDDKKEEIECFIKEEKINLTKEEDEDNNKQIFYLDKNTLCVIEIKNQFPPYRSEEERKKINNNKDLINKYPIDFYNMVKSLVKKSLIFQDMFVQLNEKIDSIKLVLFYDAVHKFNYGKELNKVMVELFNTAEDKKLLEMFEFQCIFIKSSYLAGEYFDAKREINKLKYKNDKFESELKAKTNEIDKLDNLVSELKAKMDNQASELKAKMDNQASELKAKMDNQASELKAKTIKINKLDNLVSELKDEINSLRNEIKILNRQNQGEGDDNKNIDSKKELSIKKEKYDNNSPIASVSNLSEQKEETIKKVVKKDDSKENNQ